MRAYQDGMGQAEIVMIGKTILGRGTYQPGWVWSEHLKPIAGTDSCQVEHTDYILQDRMVVKMDGGSEVE